jgi:predicted glutamine amidotransferase
MCQLLGMNCNTPTDICFSFEGFRARGGKTDRHTDGWGIAFFEGRGCRLFMDTQASVSSPVAELVRAWPIHSRNVIAHLRKATVGAVALENTQPFVRELWGRYWAFAHNGDVPEFRPGRAGPYRPVGDTDSERAFCALLSGLQRRFPEAPPAAAALVEALAEETAQVARHGVFNYLLSDGNRLIAHCSTRLSWLVRAAPFATARLIDEDLSVDFSRLTRPDDSVAVIATAPLTDNETWHTFEPAQMRLFQDGAPRLTLSGVC